MSLMTVALREFQQRGVTGVRAVAALSDAALKSDRQRVAFTIGPDRSPAGVLPAGAVSSSSTA
jgi:hypothetical protein